MQAKYSFVHISLLIWMDKLHCGPKNDTLFINATTLSILNQFS